MSDQNLAMAEQNLLYSDKFELLSPALYTYIIIYNTMRVELYGTYITYIYDTMKSLGKYSTQM